MYRKLIFQVDIPSQETINISINIDNGLEKYTIETLQEIIPKRIKENMQYFDADLYSWIKAADKRQELYYQKPETNFKKIRPIVEYFGVSHKTYIQAILTYPALLTMDAEHIIDNVIASAMCLGMSPNDFFYLALRKPQLLCQSPYTLNDNFEALIQYCGSAALARKKILENPIYLTYAQERTIVHARVKELTGMAYSLKLNPIDCLKGFAAGNPEAFTAEQLDSLIVEMSSFIDAGKRSRAQG